MSVLGDCIHFFVVGVLFWYVLLASESSYETGFQDFLRYS